MNSVLPLLAQGAQQMGFTLSASQLEQFQLYYEMLTDWNSRINLTSITEYEEVQRRHFLDSLTVGATLRAELQGIADGAAPPSGYKVVDVGTGAGFPGVPLKILWPQIALTLSDSVGKKTIFLRELTDALGLRGVKVATARAEELGRDKAQREQYDLALARAVAALPVLCEYCLPLVRVGGRLLAPKKGDISQELAQAERAAPVLGGTVAEQHSFLLPGEEEKRTVVVVRKLSPTPPGYPRRVGLPKLRPLGE